MKKKIEKKEKTVQKESNASAKTPKEFKQRHYSEAGKSVLEDLKRATDAEKEHRKSEREG